MPDPRLLALVMAGGAGSRLEVLTEQRAKPAMPYAGIYRLIDFPLSNCMHSGIADVWVIQQYQPHSLNDHVSNGRPWDLDRTHGGLRILQPQLGGEESGWHKGNADAIFRHKSLIEEAGVDVVLVLSSDHVYKLDYRDALETHAAAGAEVTIVTTKVPRAEASRFGVVEVSEGRVTGFEYKPDSPKTDIATTEVFVFDAHTLLDTLEDLHEKDEREAAGGEEGGERLEDFGDVLLPRLVAAGGAREHRLEGYWRDLGLIESYWAAHMDLLGRSPRITLDDPAWPIHTLGVQRPPARLEGSARVEDGLVSPGSWISGRVERSVLGPGVRVEPDACVRDSVILHDAVIASGARVDCAIVDMEARVEDGARVGRRLERAPGDVESSDIAVVGRGARVEGRTKPGARVEAAAVPGGSR